ncbi:MAG: helix-turn-helix domain-containing protein [Pirellulales bacterium]|nr:helix-turn-helix domain-containing protein [Pirellulales bacterium]MDA7992005.1 helix-turn-helix domain-containing protein [Pirellulales bacterium]
MAGGFLDIAEAAAHLNISEDAVKQLVDQRKLFSLRDTSGLKFKREELDRYLEDQKDILATDGTAPGNTESGLSLDGLELDLSDSESTSQENNAQQPNADAPANVNEEQPGSEIGLGELELESGLSLAEGSNIDDGPAIEATGILPAQEAEASLLIGGDLDSSDIDVPATLLGTNEEFSQAQDKDISPQEQDIEAASSDALGKSVDISGIDIDLSGVDIADSAAAEEPAQSLVLGDSLAGDIESIVASDIFIDEGLASAVFETDGSGSVVIQDSGSIEASNSSDFIDDNETSGIIDSDPLSDGSDIGSAISDVKMEGGLSLEDGKIQAWDVDLGEFLNDVEDDPDAATMLGTANDFDLDAEGSSTDDPSQSADLASSQAGDSMFDKSAGPGDSSFFGDEVGQDAAPLTAASDMLSSSFALMGDDARFNSLQVTGLICCALLLLVGGLLTFDLVRTIGSSADTSLSNPLVGSLSQLFGWRQ